MSVYTAPQLISGVVFLTMPPNFGIRFSDLEIARSHKLPNVDNIVDVEAALYPFPSLCPTQRGCFGLADCCAAEFQTSEAVAALCQ